MCCCDDDDDDDAEHDRDVADARNADDVDDDVTGMLKESRDDKTSGLSEMFSSLILSTLR